MPVGLGLLAICRRLRRVFTESLSPHWPRVSRNSGAGGCAPADSKGTKIKPHSSIFNVYLLAFVMYKYRAVF